MSFDDASGVCAPSLPSLQIYTLSAPRPNPGPVLSDPVTSVPGILLRLFPTLLALNNSLALPFCFADSRGIFIVLQ